jgi:hypothetical protein
MERITWWARHGAAVRQALAWGASAHRETARAACTEALRLGAIDRGLWQHGARACPDPRGEPERAREGIGPAQSAARVAGRYARRTAGSGRRAARG